MEFRLLQLMYLTFCDIFDFIWKNEYLMSAKFELNNKIFSELRAYKNKNNTLYNIKTPVL